jgi:hypothetical protein
VPAIHSFCGSGGALDGAARLAADRIGIVQSCSDLGGNDDANSFEKIGSPHWTISATGCAWAFSPREPMKVGERFSTIRSA